MRPPSLPEKKTLYRPDVDGLRALAVISVILFHLDKTILPGGFVGVDIFFVISGYLISQHIFRDIENKRFSLIEFYRRRVKRIAPAMLAVVVAVVLLTQVAFRPEDAEKAAESGLWSILSLANVYFWLHQDTSYFAAASNQLPLLHLWSLGVEEQFYIFWPLILICTYRRERGKYFVAFLTIIGLLSFLLGQYLYNDKPLFVYYMLPTRAGELMVGALAAMFTMRIEKPVISVFTVKLAASTGLILIVGSLFLLSENQIFPGFRAIPPTIGAAMLIVAGHYGKSWPSRLLMLRPMIWIGVVSYSAYLWHWPLIAFYHYSQIEIPPLAGIIIFISTFLLAWASYKYIETPARKSDRSAIVIFKNQYILPGTAIALLALTSMKMDGYGLRWFSSSYKSSLATLRDETRPAYSYDYVCQRQRITEDDAENKKCIIGKKSNEPPKAILWGDSNAAHYAGMLGVFAKKAGFRLRNLEVGSCPPLDVDPKQYVQPRRYLDCLASQKIALSTIDKFKVVIISASWPDYQYVSDDFLKKFFAMTKKLTAKGKTVIILGKVPVIATYDRLCREKSLSFPFMSCSTESVVLSKDVSDINEDLRKFAKQMPNVYYYDATTYLCADNRCSAFNKIGKPIYFDSSHLTLSESWQLGQYIYQHEGVPKFFDNILNL